MNSNAVIVPTNLRYSFSEAMKKSTALHVTARLLISLCPRAGISHPAETAIHRLAPPMRAGEAAAGVAEDIAVHVISRARDVIQNRFWF